MTEKELITESISNQLIKTSSTIIGDETVNSIDARDLHIFLGLKIQFTEWIKPKIKDYGFVINSDFYRSTCTADNGREMETYIITIDMAKELSMLSQTEKGKQARKYFIQCEKELRKLIPPPIKMLDTTGDLEACVKMASIFGLKGNQALLSANTAVKKLHGIDCMALLEINGFVTEDKVQYLTPTVVGRPYDLSAVNVNKTLERAGFQTATRDHRNRIVWVVTEKGLDHAQLLDTNKKRSDGTPIQQVKWAKDVIDFALE